MTEPASSKWATMATAPRDGSLVLVRLRASEQGPSAVDTVRWAKSARSGEEGWLASDSDPFARVGYAEGELSGWMPLPSQRSPTGAARARPGAGTADADKIDDEADGAGI